MEGVKGGKKGKGSVKEQVSVTHGRGQQGQDRLWGWRVGTAGESNERKLGQLYRTIFKKNMKDTVPSLKVLTHSLVEKTTKLTEHSSKGCSVTGEVGTHRGKLKATHVLQHQVSPQMPIY